MNDKLTFAIGDIHGRLDLLRTLLDRIGSYADGRQHKLVFLGDYIDRGPDSAGVVELIRAWQASRPNYVTCLTGNHEEMLLHVIANPEDLGWWLMNGGNAALESWGVDCPTKISPDVIEWFRGLPKAHQDDLRIYVHAGMRPGGGLEEQRPQDLIWIREPFLSIDYDFGKHVVHGHTPLSSFKPDERPYRTNLDTAAVFGGDLTAGIFNSLQRSPIGFLQAKSPTPLPPCNGGAA